MVLESKGIVVILGMDWLSKHNILIVWAEKSINLTTLNENELEYVEEPVVIAKGAANSADLNQLDVSPWSEVRVVHEFFGVFPKELSVVPADRDIELVIELVSDTAPM
jgi:hypothetical protein